MNRICKVAHFVKNESAGIQFDPAGAAHKMRSLKRLAGHTAAKNSDVVYFEEECATLLILEIVLYDAEATETNLLGSGV